MAKQGLKRCRFLLIKKNENKQKIASLGWGLGPVDMGQKCLNLPQLWRHPQKISKPKFPNFLNRNYKTFRNFRGFEQLSSSIRCQVMAEQNIAKILAIRD